MQDALSQDMFNLGGISSSRCNGHIPVSSAGKAPKRDRKGCKKGKIEAIMKNNLVSSKARVRLQTAAVVKKLKPVQSVSNHIIKPGTVIKSEYIDSDDPYTFTETEPQVLSLYPGGNNLTLSRKLVPLVSNRSNQLVVNKSGVNMVCMDRNSDMGKVKTLAERLTTQGGQTIELPSRPFIKVNKVVQNLEGSSKTMNRLQADIARNKIMGKRKKMVVNNQSGSVWGERDVKTEPNGHANSPVFANVSIPAKRTHRQTTWQRERKSRHEALQRIQQTQQRAWDLTHDLYPLGLELSDSEGEGEKDEDGRGVFQRHWFMGCVSGGGGGREARLAQVAGELRRRVCQVWRGLERSRFPQPELVSSVLDAAQSHPVSTALLLHPRLKFPSKQSRAKVSMLAPQKCSLDCDQIALPCTRHCAQHIMYNVDQLLFQHCTAKFTDNTQCCAPVFDITHHHPLCPKHASAYDNVMKAHSEGKPKKSQRKKSKPAALTRSTKRGKKKKKPRPSTSSDFTEVEMPEIEIKTEVEQILVDESGTCINNMDQIMLHSSPGSEVFLTDAAPLPQGEVQVQLEDAVEVVSDEVLAIASMDPTELVTQASRLLEEHDITSMLNQIPADAFTDIFLDKNGEYEPTREQTEGLERALEEVDKEVRSLERMTRSLPLPCLPIDPINLLDDVGGYVTYPNGFTSVAQASDLRHT
uniref:KANL2-like probable zinc-finger domain-containing protein n=1 Tax=Homalodisca liturata TaxID=320908 RepID=A0A1B6HCL5_9HEMI